MSRCFSLIVFSVGFSVLAPSLTTPAKLRQVSVSPTRIDLAQRGNPSKEIGIEIFESAVISPSSGLTLLSKTNDASATAPEFLRRLRPRYPDAMNTGPDPAIRLKRIPEDISVGPGWFWDSRGYIRVEASGATLTGFITKGFVYVTAPNVTISQCRILVSSSGFHFGIQGLGGDIVVSNCEISGANGNSLRLDYGIAANGTITRNNIFNARTAIAVDHGVVSDNYIHQFGFISGDHTNGIMSTGGDTAGLTITHNAVLLQFDQTDSIGLFPDFGVCANATIEDNLIAGGSYTLYGGEKSGAPATYNIKVLNNRFSTKFFPGSGYYGPYAYFNGTRSGNEWAGNVWHETGQPVQ